METRIKYYPKCQVIRYTWNLTKHVGLLDRLLPTNRRIRLILRGLAIEREFGHRFLCECLWNKKTSGIGVSIKDQDAKAYALPLQRPTLFVLLVLPINIFMRSRKHRYQLEVWTLIEIWNTNQLMGKMVLGLAIQLRIFFILSEVDTCPCYQIIAKLDMCVTQYSDINEYMSR